MTETETGAAAESPITDGYASILGACIKKTEVELLSGAPSSCRLPTGQCGSLLHFCAQCGTYVWSMSSPGFCFVRVTTLDD